MTDAEPEMEAKDTLSRYVIISPVKDEEQYVEFTLQSVTRQTLKPVLWVIVDDGSSDRTPEIISRYASLHSYIRLISNPNSGVRQTGSAVMRTFKFGYESLNKIDYDFIVKLDCDLSFEPFYFEKLFGRFAADDKLGIASGVYLEMDKVGKWKEIVMPPYHAAGASKMLRRRCFEDIGGFIVAAGWDTVDEIRAMTRGWKTCHFKDLLMNHHKTEGSGIGTLRTSVMHGEIYRLTGGDKLFLALKVIHRMSAKPYVISAIALLWGYLKTMMKRKAMLVTKKETLHYQALLRERLRSQAKTLFARS